MKKETITLTDFRAHLYGMIDDMLSTGQPLLMERHGRIIEVREKPTKKTPKKKTKKLRDLSKIVPIKCMVMDPDWYISPKLSEWSGEIDPNLR